MVEPSPLPFFILHDAWREKPLNSLSNIWRLESDGCDSNHSTHPEPVVRGVTSSFHWNHQVTDDHELALKNMLQKNVMNRCRDSELWRENKDGGICSLQPARF